MALPKVIDNFLNGEDTIKTAVKIDNESIVNLFAGLLISCVLIFIAYKIIVKN